MCYCDGMRILAAAVLAFLMAVHLPEDGALAQEPQREEQLDLLFGKLKDPALGAKSMSTEAQIWDLWMRAGTDQQNEALLKAASAMQFGSFKLSEQMLNQLLEVTQSNAEVYNKRATLYYLMGRYEESLADIVKVLELEPRHFGALSGRGMVYQRLGKPLEALAAYREALLVNPHLLGARIAVKQLEKLEPDL
jgi:tetratricopeptide (TPR) repeat protein